MPAKNSPSKPEETPSFESCIERLEQIVEQMETDKLPLEELIVRYEEGIKLVKVCSEKLDAAEKKIQIIMRDTAGKPKLAEFEPEEKTQTSGGENAALF